MEKTMEIVNAADCRYCVVLTSCGRFDLLRRTVQTFLQFADIPPEKFVVVEDSGDGNVRAALAGLRAPFEFVVNNRRLGQAASIDKGYARVTTPFVFHCEDDWEFFRPGFVAESFALLNALPQASAVMLRGRDENRRLRKLPAEETNGVRFFLARPKMHRRFFGYGYNPGLRRMEDYNRVAPLAKIGSEGEVSFVFSRLGFVTAHLEIPAVCHLGWGRSIPDPSQPATEIYLRKKINQWRSEAKILKWKIFGLPKKWQHPPPPQQ